MLLRTLLASLGLALLGCAPAWAATPLFSAPELHARIADPSLRVIDIRSPKDFAERHIPGAVSAPYGQWRGEPSNPGELPPLTKLTELVQGLGLGPQTHAVVVSHGTDATDFGAAARVYWTLKVLGLKQLSVLDGGMVAWQQAGLPLTQSSGQVARSDYRPTLDARLIATRDELAKRLSDDRLELVDARPKAFFQGETRHQAAAVPGTLPGASSLEHSSWFVQGTGKFLPRERIESVASAAGVPAGVETVSFCNTGHWAATNWFVLSEVLGRPDVKLYAGSMVDWTHADEPLPMNNVPGRAQQLLIDLKLWLARTFG